jgi:hypothetical protein
MDPHSTLSQFNQRRPPKPGPIPHKYMDPHHPKPALDSFTKRPSASRKTASPAALIRRPIATNSRVKQDEKYRKDMHLAFVNNALLQKANVSRFLPTLHSLLILPPGHQRAIRRINKPIQHKDRPAARTTASLDIGSFTCGIATGAVTRHPRPSCRESSMDDHGRGDCESVHRFRRHASQRTA